ncbi:DNA modification methylase (N.MgoV) [Neisseria gonorrhoeae]|uniref:DNA modification methylase (N.MgoV) n=1 Tax=Neisseria gonorrhoeae TaxID=485 RepID=A0A378VXX9_NEIGO|nr:DNA modification methylase (N.MgoV) [Neisseria gonorrhoeae]
MDMEHLFVVDNGGLRTLTGKEGLRLFGYPDDYSFDIPKKTDAIYWVIPLPSL